MRLLAADFGELLPLIVGAIALISWIANKVKDRGGGGVEAPDVQPADEGGRVQAEIDRFLQEVRGGHGQAAGANAAAAENVPETPAAAARQEQRRQSRPAQEAAPPEKYQRLSERHVIGNRHIDSSVDEGVFEGESSDRMRGLVERDVGHGVEQSVLSHLGPSSVTEAEANVVRDDGANGLTAESLVELLTQPDGIRQAVLVQEILSRPKGRRGRSGL